MLSRFFDPSDKREMENGHFELWDQIVNEIKTGNNYEKLPDMKERLMSEEQKSVLTVNCFPCTYYTFCNCCPLEKHCGHAAPTIHIVSTLTNSTEARVAAALKIRNIFLK